MGGEFGRPVFRRFVFFGRSVSVYVICSSVAGLSADVKLAACWVGGSLSESYVVVAVVVGVDVVGVDVGGGGGVNVAVFAAVAAAVTVFL